jgi:hypothetical protein
VHLSAGVKQNVYLVAKSQLTKCSAQYLEVLSCIPPLRVRRINLGPSMGQMLSLIVVSYQLSVVSSKL